MVEKEITDIWKTEEEEVKQKQQAERHAEARAAVLGQASALEAGQAPDLLQGWIRTRATCRKKMGDAK